MNPKQHRGGIAASLIVASIAMAMAARSPQFGLMRNVDILLIFGAGMSFGAAIFQLVRSLRQRA